MARDFAAASSRYKDDDHGPGRYPIAWTGFGSSVALLSASDQELVLDRLLLSSEGGRITRWGVAQRLATGLPLTVLDHLIAPPLALRLGTALVTTDAIRFYPHEDPHLASPGGPREWLASSADETLCAAAVGAEGDLFLATVGSSGQVTVRAVDGSALARIEHLPVPVGAGLGMAIQRPAGTAEPPDLFVAWLWTDEQLYRLPLAFDGVTATQIQLEGLVAPPLLWRARLQAGTPIPWHGWRCAGTGVYPVLGPEREQTALFGLNLCSELPRLVNYSEGALVGVVAECPHHYLIVQPDRIRVLDPFSGRMVAEEEALIPEDTVFAGTSAGTFVSLQRSERGLVLRGLRVRRGAAISEGFEAPMRVPGAEEPLRMDSRLPPLETDEGLLVGLEEGAGAAACLRLWHGVVPFIAGSAR